MINVYVGYVWHEGFNNIEVGMRVNGHTYGEFIYNADDLNKPSDHTIIYLVRKLNKAIPQINDKISLIISDKRLKRLSRSERWLNKHDWTTDNGEKVNKEIWNELYKLINSGKVKVRKVLTVNDEQEIAFMIGDLKKGWLYGEFGKTIAKS